MESDSVNPGFDAYRFVHEALPETDLQNVETTCSLFGHSLSAPLIISSMTGGTSEGGRMNRVLAESAQTLGLGVGVGSQRIALLNPEIAGTFRVRDVAPNVLLFANIGAIQLNNGFGLDECRAAVEMIAADALVLHLNPLQESVQPGGDTNFMGLIHMIEHVCSNLGKPVIAKEVGQGISERTARMLRDAGVSVIDTAGAGGTSWALVESLREHNGKSEIGNAFANWGIPTAESIVMARRGAPDVTLIASGGLRSGLDAAKAIALGADFVSFGLPLLREAAKGPDAVISLLQRYIDELRIAMFCIAASSIGELKGTSSLRRICPECGGLKSAPTH